ncbi:MAG: response regulator [Acidobacteria bacterium]|nr:response regulator [Acidobacteriota bacterium]
MRKNGKVTMLISSKNALFLEGIRAVLRQDPSIEIVGEVSQLAETIEEAIRLRPQVVLLDGILTDLSILDAIRRLKKTQEEIRILATNISETLPSTMRFRKAGVSVYVPPQTRPEELFLMIHGTDPQRQRYAHAGVASRKKNHRKVPKAGMRSFRLEERKTI